jgi:CelD/BcsL family acetyltransferase involved in cellulose biosynthesis
MGEGLSSDLAAAPGTRPLRPRVSPAGSGPGGGRRARGLWGRPPDDAHRQVLLPWVVATQAGRFTRRRMLGPVGSSLFGYHDPLVGASDADGIDWSSFWESTRRELARSCDQALFRFVHPRYTRGVATEPCGEESPVLSLAGLSDLQDALARCSTNHRSDVRRRLRRLEEKGEVRLWVAGPSEASAAMQDFSQRFVPAYHNLWRSRPSGSLLDRPGVVAFLARVLADGVPGSWGHYAILYVADTPIAWHLGLSHHRSLYWWVPTHDRAWDNWSPGKVLLAKLIEYGIARNWTRLHFLTGGHAYKLAWRPEAEDLLAVRWHAPTFVGRILGCYDGLHGWLKTGG